MGYPRRLTGLGIRATGTVVLAFFTLSCTVLLAGSTSKQTASRQHYADEIRRTYNFQFGIGTPFRPSNAQIEGDDFIQPGAFPTAAYCGHCHTAAYQQWQQSLHRNSFRAPFYTKNANFLADTKGVEYTRHCEGCHNPISLFSGALTQNSHVDRSFDDDGITCSVCHSIERLQPSYGTGSYVMGVPAVILDAKGSPIPGVVPDKEILAHPDRHSRAVMKDFYKSPEFCGACHKASIPRELSGYKWLRAISLYDEWQSSAVSGNSPLAFYQKSPMTCQNCHMPRDAAGQGEYGAKHGTLASHRWVGGNTAVPFFYGLSDQLQKTADFLSNKTLNVDIFAMKKVGSDELIAPLGSTAFNINPGEQLEFFVVIQNRGIGHSLIPEQRDFYEAWVEFLVKDGDGSEVFHSGFLNPDGTLDQTAHSFTNRLIDSDGQLLSNHEIWLRRAVAYDQTILAGHSTIVCYQFRIPQNVKGPLSVTSRVNYRHFNQGYLDYVLGSDHLAYPVVEMASQVRTVSLGNNPAIADAGANPDWMRWNNFGIGFLDQGQYGAATNAFSHVANLRPDYADGRTNVALANLLWEKYSDARASIDQALELSPNNPRSLYYRGLIERVEGDLDASVTDLQLVAKQFPRSREVSRELAVSYYLTRKDELARQEFEIVQSVDPDDVAAHYYLAILYRRVGMNDKADEQAALYTDKRDDSSAPTRVSVFLRKHPDADNESLPLHVHSETELRTTGPTKH